MKTIQQRLDDKSFFVPFCGCKIWTGGNVPRGYGVIHYKGKQRYAHRVQYELAYGEIPKGFFVLHQCDVPSCINPNHLFLGSAKDNTQDMLKKNRCNPAKGEKTGNAKLTWKQVDEIRSQYIPYHRKFGGGALAKKYKTNSSTITNIVANKYWTKHDITL